jgi:DNA-binding MarR family transcriptional regulator
LIGACVIVQFFPLTSFRVMCIYSYWMVTNPTTRRTWLELMVIDKEKCLEMAQHCACFHLRRASRLVSQAFDQELKPSGLKVTQFTLLSVFVLHEDMGIGKVARILGMDRTTLSRNLKLLEKMGLIQLEPGQDRREQLAKVTEKGEEAFMEGGALWEKAQKKALANIGHQKWAEVQAGLNLMINGLKS